MLHINHPLLQFTDITALLGIAALFSAFYVTGSRPELLRRPHLARRITKSYAQYAIEIGSNCQF